MQMIEMPQIVEHIQKARFIVIDRAVVEHYRLIRLALAGKEVFYIDDPEIQKNLEFYQQGVNFFLEKHISRDDELFVIGGGATSDLGGFIAATVLRGIKWKVYPTTILAMVDAAIGGKVGVNCEYGKNLIGSFHLPTEVYVCTEFISTLPKEEIISGQGEIIKYGFLSSEIFNLFSYAEKQSLIIRECAKFKEDIVKNDFKESGKRKILNLGHTFGHPIEKLLQIPHGLAVIIGLKLIVDIYAPHLKNEMNSIFKNYKFNLDIPTIDFNAFCELLKSDKKTKSNGTIDLIIPKNIGEVVIENHDIHAVIEKIRNYSDYETFFS